MRIKRLKTNPRNKAKPNAGTRLLFSISLIIALTGILTISAINWSMKRHAREEASEKAMILLDRNLATHTYFSHQIKPVLFNKLKTYAEDNYFEPVWMSSTYAVREIDKYYHSLTEKDYYYKEAAINSRSPENEADTFERNFIEKLNRSPELNEYSGIRFINEEPFFVVMRRGESMEKSCLRCHGTPEVAPADMVSLYGPERSFNRGMGEAVSAFSIRMPLNAAYTKINRLIVHLSVIFGVILLIAYGFVLFFSKRWIFTPLNFIRKKAIKISRDPIHLGEQIDLPATHELSELTEAFNNMSSQLRQERDSLESRVDKRTRELHDVNSQLIKEVDEHKRTIAKLEATLKELKILRGILPICAYCKKIRDDEGYWAQIESYIKAHSEVDFTHGICPECAKKHFPNYEIYRE
jgi:HAMP domain-containing protein